jgi:hypothetical protein
MMVIRRDRPPTLLLAQAGRLPCAAKRSRAQKTAAHQNDQRLRIENNDSIWILLFDLARFSPFVAFCEKVPLPCVV